MPFSFKAKPLTRKNLIRYLSNSPHIPEGYIATDVRIKWVPFVLAASKGVRLPWRKGKGRDLEKRLGAWELTVLYPSGFTVSLEKIHGEEERGGIKNEESNMTEDSPVEPESCDDLPPSLTSLFFCSTDNPADLIATTEMPPKKIQNNLSQVKDEDPFAVVNPFREYNPPDSNPDANRKKLDEILEALQTVPEIPQSPHRRAEIYSFNPFGDKTISSESQCSWKPLYGSSRGSDLASELSATRVATDPGLNITEDIAQENRLVAMLPAVTPHKEGDDHIKTPKSPHGHPGSDPGCVKAPPESPLFRRSLIGRRPDSPIETVGAPLVLIPHGLENPGFRRSKGRDGLGAGSLETKQDENRDIKREHSEESYFEHMLSKESFTASMAHLEKGHESDMPHHEDVEMGDENDEIYPNVEPKVPHVVLDHNLLSSPVICLTLNHQDAMGHCISTNFHVHKVLLKLTSIAGQITTPETDIVLDPVLKPYAVSAVVQGLYTGDFTVDDSFGSVEDSEGYFEKLAYVELACRHFWAFGVRDIALKKIAQAYEEFEFQMNPGGMAMRVKMAEWAWGIGDELPDTDKSGIVLGLRQRVIGGWVRDVSLLHTNPTVSTAFQELLIYCPSFSNDLSKFLVRRFEEDANCFKRKLDAFALYERQAKQRWENEYNVMNIELKKRVASRPKILPFIAYETPVHEARPFEFLGEDKTDPPKRKKITRVEDKLQVDS